MALSTDQYGYLIDPLVPITDATGTTIKDGFLRVYIAGSSTPVITYRNYDGAANEQTIELDNSGRCKYPVIVSKSLAYKVVVYDAQHSQETPIITVDKMFAIGASVTAGAGSTIVQGLDNVEGESDGFVKASVTGTTANVKLDATNVSHELTGDAAVGYAANAGYMVPALSNDPDDPGDPQKLPLAWIWANKSTQVVLTPADFLGDGLSNDEWAAAVAAISGGKTAVVKWTESGASRVAVSSLYEAGVGLVFVAEYGGFVTEYVVASAPGAHAVTTNVYDHNGDTFEEVNDLMEASDFNADDELLVVSPNRTRKMLWTTLANKVLGFIKSLATTITDFRTGDVIPVDGPSGTAKMGKDDLLRETAENAVDSGLAESTIDAEDKNIAIKCLSKAMTDSESTSIVVGYDGVQKNVAGSDSANRVTYKGAFTPAYAKVMIPRSGGSFAVYGSNSSLDYGVDNWTLVAGFWQNTDYDLSSFPYKFILVAAKKTDDSNYTADELKNEIQFICSAEGSIREYEKCAIKKDISDSEYKTDVKLLNRDIALDLISYAMVATEETSVAIGYDGVQKNVAGSDSANRVTYKGAFTPAYAKVMIPRSGGSFAVYGSNSSLDYGVDNWTLVAGFWQNTDYDLSSFPYKFILVVAKKPDDSNYTADELKNEIQFVCDVEGDIKDYKKVATQEEVGYDDYDTTLTTDFRAGSLNYLRGGVDYNVSGNRWVDENFYEIPADGYLEFTSSSAGLVLYYSQPSYEPETDQYFIGSGSNTWVTLDGKRIYRTDIAGAKYVRFGLQDLNATTSLTAQHIGQGVKGRLCRLEDVTRSLGVFGNGDIVVVDANGNGDYTKIEDALAGVNDTPTHHVTILVMPGTYTPAYRNGAEIYPTNYRNLSIIGLDRDACKIVGTVGFYNGAVGVDCALISVNGNVLIKNLTFKNTCEDYADTASAEGWDTTEKHAHAYCVHFDGECNSGDVRRIENCVMFNDHMSCIGWGLRADSKLEIVNCECECNVYAATKLISKFGDGPYGVLYGHTQHTSSPAYNQYLAVKGCIVRNVSDNLAISQLIDSTSDRERASSTLLFTHNIMISNGTPKVRIDQNVSYPLLDVIDDASYGNNLNELNA